MSLISFLSSGRSGIHVSTSGDYDNSGRAGDPITAAKLQDISLSNTKVLFKKGDIFDNFTLNSSYNDTVFASYGTGNNPVISGKKIISDSWTSEGGGIYSISITDALKWVYLDGTQINVARCLYKDADSVPVDDTITTAETTYFNAFTNLTGAKLRISEYAFRQSYEYTVQSYSAGTFTVDRDFEGAIVHTDRPFYLYGQLQFLTLDNTWFYDSSAEKLYIKLATAPTNYTIEYGNQDNGFIISGDNVVFKDGIDFCGYQKASIRGSGASTQVTSCNFYNSQGSAILINGNQLGPVISSCNFHDLSGNAISLGALDTPQVLSNTFNNIGNGDIVGLAYTDALDSSFPGGVLNGYGTTDDRFRLIGCAVKIELNFEESRVHSINAIIQNNNISNIGYIGVHITGDDYLIDNNDVDAYGSVFTDVGGIYGKKGADANLPGASCDGGEISNNNVHDFTLDLNWNFWLPSTRASYYVDEEMSNTDINNNVSDGSAIHDIFYSAQAGTGNVETNNSWN